MLLARGHTAIGDASLRWAVIFARRVWAIVVERSGLALDTRFIPASKAPAAPRGCLYLLRRGAWEIHGAETTRIEAPAAFALSHEQLEGAAGARAFTFRATGEPFSAIELHVASADLVPSPAAIPALLEIGPRAWEAATRAAELSRCEDDALVGAVGELLARLAERGFLRADAAASALTPTPRPFARLWSALRPMIERLYLSPTLQEVSDAASVSVRQVDRHVQDFVRAFGLVGDGWRPATRHLRLKVSVLLLSAEGASVADVAAASGYGTADALGRAFRDAGLRPPSVVQRELRALAQT